MESLTEENEKRHGDSVLQVAVQEKEMISNALNGGSSAEDISRVTKIPLAEVEAIAKGEKLM